MLYTILFAALIYVNSGQGVDLPECDPAGDGSECDGLNTAQTLALVDTYVGVSGETFVCSSNLGICTS